MWRYYHPKFEYLDQLNPWQSGWTGHIFFAYDLVANTTPHKVVELGTCYGHSFFSFAQAVKDLKLDTQLVAVDTWAGDPQAGFYDNSVFETMKQVQTSHYSSLNITILRKTFDDAINDIADQSIDLLHIDGWHTYEAVKHDFELWRTKIKEDGIILLHDIAVIRDDFGVHQLWTEIQNQYHTHDFKHSHGLGIVLLPQYSGSSISSAIQTGHYEIMADNFLNIDHQQKKLENLTATHDITQQLLKDKENELAAVYQSWSWRLTTPLRFLVNLFLGKKR